MLGRPPTAVWISARVSFGFNSLTLQRRVEIGPRGRLSMFVDILCYVSELLLKKKKKKIYVLIQRINNVDFRNW